MTSSNSLLPQLYGIMTSLSKLLARKYLRKTFEGNWYKVILQDQIIFVLFSISVETTRDVIRERLKWLVLWDFYIFFNPLMISPVIIDLMFMNFKLNFVFERLSFLIKSLSSFSLCTLFFDDCHKYHLWTLLMDHVCQNSRSISR